MVENFPVFVKVGIFMHIYGIVCEAMEIFLVIPTIRNLNFLVDWADEFRHCHILVVEDGPSKTVSIPPIPKKEALHYCWKDIQADFGSNEWIFSRENAGIRSYGFWKAYELEADIILTLDDDCYPVEKGFVAQHVDNLLQKAPDGWTSTYPHPDYMFTRGVPYSVRNKHRTVVSHGLWTNKIDLDGITEMKHQNLQFSGYPPIRQFIPPGVYFPMCSMNLAFHRDATPLMYFPIMGKTPEGSPWGYDRFDDIWAGIFAKKIIDHLGWSVVNGSPFVEHRRASDFRKNIAKEKRGIQTNEHLWQQVDAVVLHSKTPAFCYIELAQKIHFPQEKYFERLREAMIYWGKLFHE
jgi:reversibly glycosylated polypeptide/UDP-arabinopyranose mutase